MSGYGATSWASATTSPDARHVRGGAPGLGAEVRSVQAEARRGGMTRLPLHAEGRRDLRDGVDEPLGMGAPSGTVTGIPSDLAEIDQALQAVAAQAFGAEAFDQLARRDQIIRFAQFNTSHTFKLF